MTAGMCTVIKFSHIVVLCVALSCSERHILCSRADR